MQSMMLDSEPGDKWVFHLYTKIIRNCIHKKSVQVAAITYLFFHWRVFLKIYGVGDVEHFIYLQCFRKFHCNLNIFYSKHMMFLF